MDFHFYNSPESSKNVFRPKVLIAFLPLFVLAALLPAFLTLVRNPVSTRPDAEAQINDLAIWLEPANVVVTHGKPVTFTVKAHYDGGGKLLPGVVVPFQVDGLASIENASVEYKAPFMGEVTLGNITVTPQKSGTFVVSVNTSGVKSLTAQVQPNPVVSTATIVSR